MVQRMRDDLYEPIVEREEERAIKEVSDSAFGDRHRPQISSAKKVCQEIARIVQNVSLRFRFLCTAWLASALYLYCSYILSAIY